MCLLSRCEDAAAWWLQVVNLVTNRVSRILGKVENTERFLRVALYQGIPKQGIKTQRQLATTESSRAVTRQPTLLCTAFNKQRLYLFTTQEPDDSDQASTSRYTFALFCHFQRTSYFLLTPAQFFFLCLSSPPHPFLPFPAHLILLCALLWSVPPGLAIRTLEHRALQCPMQVCKALTPAKANT